MKFLTAIFALALLMILPQFVLAQAQVTTVTCSSKPGERTDCPADTSKGVILAKSTGEAPCLLGKSWGYDDKGVWVSDGCSATFVVRAAGTEQEEKKGIICDVVQPIRFQEIIWRQTDWPRKKSALGRRAYGWEHFGEGHEYIAELVKQLWLQHQ